MVAVVTVIILVAAAYPHPNNLEQISHEILHENFNKPIPNAIDGEKSENLGQLETHISEKDDKMVLRPKRWGGCGFKGSMMGC